MLKKGIENPQTTAQKDSEKFRIDESELPADFDSLKSLEILFIPFVIFLVALSVFRYFSEPEVNSSQRSPSSISEIEAISVPTALKTVIQISNGDFDKSTTVGARKDLENGITPAFMEKSSAVILQKVKNGEMKFYSFTVLESIDDNGDEVQIFIDGLAYTPVVLSRTETKISVPIEFGKSKLITIKAVRDAGDGISFGAKVLKSEFLLDNIQNGESDSIYLGFSK